MKIPESQCFLRGIVWGAFIASVFFQFGFAIFFANVLEFWLGDGGGLQILHKRRMQIYKHYRRIIGRQVIGNESVLLDCSIFFLQINLAFVHFVAIFATSGKGGANHRHLPVPQGGVHIQVCTPSIFL